MPKHIDIAGDLDEHTAIKRISELELDLVESWLYRATDSKEIIVDQQELLELRFLCLLRNRLINNIESDSSSVSSLRKKANLTDPSSAAKSRMARTG